MPGREYRRMTPLSHGMTYEPKTFSALLAAGIQVGFVRSPMGYRV
jgi:hypothetical protein